MQIDFYISPATSFSACLALVSKIVKKAYEQALTVYIYAQNQAQAQQIDDQLWSHDDISFMPHEILHPSQSTTTRIHIGYDTLAPLAETADILINLSTALPTWHTQFRRIIEIVYQDPQSKAISRQHYQFYKDQGYDLKSHTL